MMHRPYLSDVPGIYPYRDRVIYIYRTARGTRRTRFSLWSLCACIPSAAGSTAMLACLQYIPYQICKLPYAMPFAVLVVQQRGTTATREQQPRDRPTLCQQPESAHDGGKQLTKSALNQHGNHRSFRIERRRAVGLDRRRC